MNEQPKTLEQFFSLPIREMISYKIKIIDGREVKVPFVNEFLCVSTEPDTIFSCFDGSAEWRLSRTKDGPCRVAY